MTKKEIGRTLEVYKNTDGDTVIKLVKPSGGFARGKEIDYIVLTEIEANKLKELL